MVVLPRPLPLSSPKPPKADCLASTEASRQAALGDAILVRRFTAGDQAAFIEIAALHRQRLFSVAFAVLKNHGDAEEIAQDALLCAYRGLDGFRGDSSLASWLHRIALNLARNRYWYFFRRRRHASISLDEALDDEGTSTFSALLSADVAGPGREILLEEFSEIAARSMGRLGESQREILTLCVSRHLSYGAIARELGISVGTVKSRIARARDRLRTLMIEACPEFDRAQGTPDWFGPVRQPHAPAKAV